jgi:hypothetical protein
MAAARPLGFLIAASIVALASAVMFGRLVFLFVWIKSWSRIAVKASVSARRSSKPFFILSISSWDRFDPF